MPIAPGLPASVGAALGLALCSGALTAPAHGQSKVPPATRPAPAQQANRAGIASWLSFDNLAAWRDHIATTTAERAWSALPWHHSFHQGLAAAAEADRPLLLWAMNGHPFGCT